MATEQQTAVSQADLAIGLDAVIGYVDTAVDTLTEEMDQQFKTLNTKLDTKFTEVLKAIKGHSHG